MVKHVMYLMGHTYLHKVLRPVIEHVMEWEGESEVDPDRIAVPSEASHHSNASAASAAMDHLMRACEVFIASFHASQADVPQCLTWMLHHVVKSVQSKFKELTAGSCLSGIVFLRFLCPS